MKTETGPNRSAPIQLAAKSLHKSRASPKLRQQGSASVRFNGSVIEHVDGADCRSVNGPRVGIRPIDRQLALTACLWADLLESLHALRPAPFCDLPVGAVGALQLDREFSPAHPI
jgi:hypothetical protein